MSGLSGQAFVSWTSSSSCHTAVAERVCFSRTADIKELKPPEPESHFTSVSMTFKRQHKHMREGLPGHCIPGTVPMGGVSQHLHSLYLKGSVHNKVLHGSCWVPSLLLQKLQLTYLSRRLRNGITFYFFSTDPLAFLNMAVCVYLYKI